MWLLQCIAMTKEVVTNSSNDHPSAALQCLTASVGMDVCFSIVVTPRPLCFAGQAKPGQVQGGHG